MKFKEMGGLMPTIFDIPEVWKLNSNRCGGKFNLLFWWLYPILVLILIPFTLMCLIEHFLKPK